MGGVLYLQGEEDDWTKQDHKNKQRKAWDLRQSFLLVSIQLKVWWE
jgi:hypothetical protein